MKNMKTIYLLLLAVASLSLLVGCGGGGGGSDEPTEIGITVTSEAVVYSDGTMGFTITADSNYKNLTVTSPTGYNVNPANGTGSNYRVTGPAIPNPGTGSINKVFTFSYTYQGESKSTSVMVSIPPNGTTTQIAVTSPVSMVGDAYKLQYSSTNHLISVEVELSASQKSEKLEYIWHKDSETGTVIKYTNSVSEVAEFIYRPNDTSVIPADVTTGTSREYNRGFKINSDFVDHYIYLVIKTQSGDTLGTLKFFVTEPVVPPTPTN